MTPDICKQVPTDIHTAHRDGKTYVACQLDEFDLVGFAETVGTVLEDDPHHEELVRAAFDDMLEKLHTTLDFVATGFTHGSYHKEPS